MMERLSRLNPRERLLVMFVMPAVLLVALFRFVWVPVQDARAETEARIAAYRTITDTAATIEAKPAGTAAVTGPRAPIAARVTESADAHGLSLRRLEPEGQRLRVTLQEAPFNSVVDWLAELEANRQVVIVAVELDRRPEPAIVSVGLMLEEAP